MTPSRFVVDGGDEVTKKIEEYRSVSGGFDDDAIAQMVSSKNKEELETIFCRRIKFGTAGLRGKMECGFNRMNIVTVQQASQGLARELVNALGQTEASRRGVVIGYDARHQSQLFAHLCAAAFLAEGLKVAMYSTPCPTPFVPFGVCALKAGCGVMVTASHNPKEDNGYKVYWDRGAQIIAPVDENISKCILEAPRNDAINASIDWSNKTLNAQKMKDVTFLDDSIASEYYTKVITELFPIKMPDMRTSRMRVVYSAMHGVGGRPMEHIAQVCKFSGLLPVQEQHRPDPEFPTVSFPNPEEEGALMLAQRLATSEGVSLLIANDPDADRFAAGEIKSDGSWHVFTGDELGILLGHYRLECLRREGVDPADMLFVCSAVSSRMLKRMCEVEGAVFEETMTGFKWMSNKSSEMREQRPSLRHALAYEEALGYQCTTLVPDKDGLTASAVWLAMASEIYDDPQSIDKSIQHRLERLRKKYGYFVTNNSYVVCKDQNILAEIFSDIRQGGEYIKEVKGARKTYSITALRDVTAEYDSSYEDKKCRLPAAGSSYMVTFTFTNGAVFTARGSGTEPKLKWYSELSGSDPKEAQEKLDDMIGDIVPNLFQTRRFGLKCAGE